MISFIIVGRNEGWKLTKCLQSVFNIIHQKSHFETEVIYVDSESTDDSLERAKSFENVRILQIRGECNAAIARNTGANKSVGDYLIFLDGDMELQIDFFNLLFNAQNIPKYPYVSGDLFNLYYDSSGQYIGEGSYYKNELDEDTYLPYTGGFFCIKKKLWENVGGMREKYRRSQDLDLGFRLAKVHYQILRKKELGVLHHTVSYSEKSRLWKMIKKNDFGYRAMLIRDHLCNSFIYKMLLRQDYTFLFLFLCIMLFVLTGIKFPFLIYPIIIGIRTAFQSDDDKNGRTSKFIYVIAKDVQMLISFFIFYPKRKKSYKIVIIN